MVALSSFGVILIEDQTAAAERKERSSQSEVTSCFSLFLLGLDNMVASAVFIMDTKGKVIIARNYRGDIPMSVAERCVYVDLDTFSSIILVYYI